MRTSIICHACPPVFCIVRSNLAVLPGLAARCGVPESGLTRGILRAQAAIPCSQLYITHQGIQAAPDHHKSVEVPHPGCCLRPLQSLVLLTACQRPPFVPLSEHNELLHSCHAHSLLCSTHTLSRVRCRTFNACARLLGRAHVLPLLLANILLICPLLQAMIESVHTRPGRVSVCTGDTTHAPHLTTTLTKVLTPRFVRQVCWQYSSTKHNTLCLRQYQPVVRAQSLLAGWPPSNKQGF